MPDIDPKIQKMAERARMWVASPEGQKTVADISKRASKKAAKLREDQRVDATTLYTQVAM